MRFKRAITSLLLVSFASSLAPARPALAGEAHSIAIGPPRIIYDDHRHRWQLPTAPAWNPANGPNVYVTTDEGSINQALIDGIRNGDPRYLNDAFKKIAEGAPAGAATIAYTAEQKQVLYQLIGSSILAGTPMSVPMGFRPTPLPAGVSQAETDRILDPLWRAAAAPKQDMIATIDQVNGVLQQVAKLDGASGLGAARAHAKADYLRAELYRTFVDRDGLVKNMPYAQSPKLTLVSDPSSPEGVSVRSGLNTVLASDSITGAGCAAAGADLQGPCAHYQSYSATLKAGYALADRLASESAGAQYTRLMASLDAGTAALRGFAQGVLQGTVSLAAGLAVAAFLPEEIVLGALAYGIYEAVSTLVGAQDSIGAFVERKGREFLDASPERQGQLVGEVVSNLAGLYYGGEATELLQGAFEHGVRMAVARESVALATDAAVAEGVLSAAQGGALNALAEAFPLEAAPLAQRGRLSAISNTLPELTKEAVDGLIVLGRYSWLEIRQGLLRHAEEILKLGQAAHERLRLGQKVASESLGASRAELEATAAASPISLLSADQIRSELSSLSFNPQGRAVALWSGGIDAKAAALTWVNEDPARRVMLELTPAGKYLDSLGLFKTGSGISKVEALELFSEASKQFVNQSQGALEVFITLEGHLKKNSVLKRIEIPELLKLPSKPNLTIHPVGS